MIADYYEGNFQAANSSATEPVITVDEIVVYAQNGTWSGANSFGYQVLVTELQDYVVPTDPDPEIIVVDWEHINQQLKDSLCDFSQAVKGLDGILPYGSDGDGVDEAINLLSAASLLTGFGTISAAAIQGGLKSAAIMGALARVFGDDIALTMSYLSLEKLTVSFGIAAGVTGGMKELYEILSDGNPPPNCGSGGTNT